MGSLTLAGERSKPRAQSRQRWDWTAPATHWRYRWCHRRCTHCTDDRAPFKWIVARSRMPHNAAHRTTKESGAISRYKRSAVFVNA